jgi:hypothetical protein
LGWLKTASGTKRVVYAGGILKGEAPSLRVEVIPVNMRDAGEIERAVADFARAIPPLSQQ